MEDNNKTFLKRIASAAKYVVSGVTPDTWFSPQQPIQPLAQQAEGRQFDYMTGYNIQIQPRSEELTSFAELRFLATRCTILRMVIETRKDQVCRFKYTFKARDKNKKISEAKYNKLNDFFLSPDKVHTFEEWIRPILEDLLVIDAPCLYPRMTRGGDLYALELMDGATIKKVIDQNGRTPIDETSPAYQQILKGVPAIDYTYKELIYKPRNLRTYKVYGYSPVEQIMTVVNTQIRRELQQLSYFTEGNTPNYIFTTPLEWNPDQIKKFQQYWNEINMGDSKYNAKFVPGGIDEINTKPEPLKNEFDDYLARQICFAFSISPQAFVKEMNRATSETAAITAADEGLQPILQWIKNLIDYVIITYFGFTDVEFVWLEDKELDPLIKSQIDANYKNAGIKTANEIREELGLDPMKEEEKPQENKVNSNKNSEKPEEK